MTFNEFLKINRYCKDIDTPKYTIIDYDFTRNNIIVKGEGRGQTVPQAFVLSSFIYGIAVLRQYHITNPSLLKDYTGFTQ